MHYKVGDFVYFEETLCVILNITNTLGFNEYRLMNTDTGQTKNAFGYQLTRVDDCSLTQEADEHCKQSCQNEEARESEARFPLLSNQQVDEIAEHRTCKSTKKQTHWAVNILRGKNFLCSVYIHPLTACSV